MAKKKNTQRNKQRQQRQQAKRQRNEKKRRARREAEKKNAALSLAPLCPCCGEPMVLTDYDHALPAPMGDNDKLLLDDEFFAMCKEVVARVEQSWFHKLRDDVDVSDVEIDGDSEMPKYFIVDGFDLDEFAVSGVVGTVHEDGRIALDLTDDELALVLMSFEAFVAFYEPLDVEELDNYEARLIDDSV